MKSHRLRKNLSILSAVVLLVSLYQTPVMADTDYEAQRMERMELPIESNTTQDWPQGPQIGAEAAILMELNTHTILYAKNIHEELYPASTTKILTCLLAAQNCSLDDMVTFSHNAVYDVPSDGSNMGMDEGESITLEQAMYGVLVGSANEAASAVAEHVAQSLGKEATVSAFAEIMNEKAKELGCLNSHFLNANGLFDENHYTSAYDLALIGCEFFNNELLCKMSSTATYHIPVTQTQPDDIWISSKNQLFSGKPYAYDSLLGSKTGYVSQARQTLVSGAEKNGMKLVCVIFMEESPYQFEDTVKLFEYGFENFQKYVVQEHETNYTVSDMDIFDTDHDLFGDSTPLMAMDSDAYIILPNTAEFTQAQSSLVYSDETDSHRIATIAYRFHDVPVGSCDILFSEKTTQAFDFSDTQEEQEISSSEEVVSAKTNDERVIFINVKTVLLIILSAAGIFTLIMVLISFINSYSFSSRGQSQRRRRKRSQEARNAKRTARINARREKRKLRQRRKAYKKRHKY